MASKIGLISDVHATPAPVQQALSIFAREGVDAILCAGDIAGYGDQLAQTVAALMDSQCQSIVGNHDIWYLQHAEDSSHSLAQQYFAGLPSVLAMELEGQHLYMVHASPPNSCMEGIKLLDEDACLIPDSQTYWQDYLRDFDYDILIVGHTHQVFAEDLAGTLVVNPGSTKFNHCCAILHLPSQSFQVFALSDQTLTRVWNWGSNQANSEG